MRLNFTLLFLLLFAFTAQSQKLTGIWRGYFSSSNGVYREGIKEEMYKYEIQIEQQQNNAVKGVTYSYKTTIFYGKATIQGIYSPNTKSIILKETGLVELEIGDKSQPCLMTCYLDYSKIGKLEVLQGTFISTNVKDKGDCGAGKVYLERVPVSDFKLEDFLTKKKPTDTTKNNAKIPLKQNSTVTNASKIRPGAEANLVPKNAIGILKDLSVEKKNNPAPTIVTIDTVVPPIPKPKVNNKIVLPKVLVERENHLVRTIQTSEENIQIELFDNGTIDHDSISVFDNNKQVIKNGELSYKPIKLKIKFSTEDNKHELIMVAENLGEIPPNTALMVITAGKQRYEIFLTSTEEKNAKVVIAYTPKQ